MIKVKIPYSKIPCKQPNAIDKQKLYKKLCPVLCISSIGSCLTVFTYKAINKNSHK